MTRLLRRMRYQRGFTAQGAAIAIGLFIGLIVLAYFIDKKPVPPQSSNSGKAVTLNTQPQSQPEPQLNQGTTTMENTQQQVKNFSHRITLTTNKGVISFDTYDSDAPKAVNNFITLAGKNYYNDVIFHRVIKGFMIQGGDPSCAANPAQDKGQCGAGGPGYKFEDELAASTASAAEGYKRGVVAMANAGPNTNGSQFFIMHQDYGLPHSYTIFGKVVEGQDVVDAIANTKTGPGDRPVEPVVISGVIVSVK